MIAKEILKQAKDMQAELVALRRELHKNAEVGFALTETLKLVERELQTMGYTPVKCGKAGLVATLVGQKGKGKTVLLRADMDALPIQEETGLPFAARNGNMHACGHDMHTTMLLCAARLLKMREKELCGRVVFMFQPAEELLKGAADMIEHGVLSPKPDAALMLHVLAGTELPTGSVVVSSMGASAPAVDFFSIQVKGKGCHGASPADGVDALSAAARIVLGLEEILARELPVGEPAVLTLGVLQAGSVANVIPDRAEIKGTMRCFEEKTRLFMKKRLTEIAKGVGGAFRAKVRVRFDSGAPALVNDERLSKSGLEGAKALFNADMVYASSQFAAEKGRKMGGSEDFAYVAEKVPALMMGLSAGTAKEGCKYPLHHPKAVFSEDILCLGGALYAYTAWKWLIEKQQKPIDKQ